jgi:hypothetical protein
VLLLLLLSLVPLVVVLHLLVLVLHLRLQGRMTMVVMVALAPHICKSAEGTHGRILRWVWKKECMKRKYGTRKWWVVRASAA